MTMRSPRPILAAALAALPLLGGCAGSYGGVESPNQAMVARADYTFDVTVDGYGLAPGESQRLAGWLATLKVAYGDKVSLDDPSGIPGLRAQVEAETARYGLFVSSYAPVTGGAIAPGTARVVVTRLVAGLPDCPKSSASDSHNFDAHTSRNFGCAVNGNIAAMVANPGDLVRGQPGADTADPATAVKAIGNYRKGSPSGGSGSGGAGGSAGGGTGLGTGGGTGGN